ncbi:hypothetical protein PORY_001878 [Pneumocystis oryctolagi]|uniref:Uncharacterized protein n=1 Tax=Pneumocystis oryctolagi TaxID=42067 RepID=A0ACB7CCQ4_9ASCO|nr:hypothetical protein PORY_001878 [Pneumocystis oryctolagi]
MNKPWSMALGWGSLIVAAGIGYCFAKKEINARRQEKMLRGNFTQDKLDWEKRVALDEERINKNNNSKDLIRKNEDLVKNVKENSLKYPIPNQTSIKPKQDPS